MPITRIVEPAGRGQWAILERPLTMARSLHHNRLDAIAIAKREVASGGGGEVCVYDASGLVERCPIASSEIPRGWGTPSQPSRFVPPPSPASHFVPPPPPHPEESTRAFQPQPPPPAAGSGAPPPPIGVPPEVEQARQNIKNFDEGVSFLSEHIWPAFGLVGLGPLLNGLVSEQLQEQSTFIGIFIATLAWSGGCLLSTVLLMANARRQFTGGFPLLFAVGICLGVSGAIATFIGIGTYSKFVTFTGSPTDVGHFMEAAIATWGPLGMILGAGSGILAGMYVFRYVDHRHGW